ncbi:MAG: HEAT repeat domain-containing protein [Methanosarcinaceae archaeon]
MVDQEEIHRKCNSDNPKERIEAVEQLRSSFKDISDKKQAWQDLYKLIEDPNPGVRRRAVEALGAIFEYVQAKEHAWQDLHKLIKDPNPGVQEKVAEALGAIFEHVPDKKQAWRDLIKLTAYQDKRVRWKAEEALETALKNVPDKGQMLKYLTEMTRAPDKYVKVNAYHSLGRISIYKASQSKSEEAYLEELKKAIEFFEKASKVPISFKPSKFCFLFYRSFYTMISGKQEAKDEVEKYLAQANKEKGWSKNKELLIKTVENLSNALKEVQNLENMDLGAKKEKLNECRKQCDKALRSMKDAASSDGNTVREGIDRKLKSLLEEIQEKAKTACRESQGTDTEEIACAVSREVQKWEIGSQEEMSWNVSNVVRVLKSKIPNTPENEEILDMIESMKYERDITKQYRILPAIIGLIPTVNVVSEEAVTEKIKNSERTILEEIRKGIQKLDEVIIYVKPGVHEELILHVGPVTPAGGGEYTLTIPLQGLSYSEMKDDLREISGKRIDQLSKLPNKIANIVETYLIKNKMEDLLDKLY